MMDVCLNHFVYERKQLSHVFQENQILGAHTDVVIFTNNKITTFRWTHAAIRPMGFQVSKQCPNTKCNYLKPGLPSISKDQSYVNLECSICHHLRTFHFPKGWNWVKGHNLQDKDRGAWIYFTEVTDDINMT